jgi:hypothetical protein
MIRLWCALIVIAVCAGCRNSPPVMDPFLGQQTVPPPGTAVLAPNASVAPPYYGATTSPSTSVPIVSPPITSPTPAAQPVTPAAPPNTTPYQYNMPPGYRPGPTGFSGVTPNVSTPGGALVQTTSGAQSLAAAPPAGNRPAYGPPGGMAFPQAPAAQSAQQPTLAQTPPALLAPASTAGARDIRGATGTPTAAAPTGWQAAANNPSAAADSAAASDPAASISPNSGGAIRIVEPMRSVQPVSTAAAPTRAPTEFRPGNTSTLTPAGGAINQTTTSAPIRDLTDLPPVQTASFNGTPIAASTAAAGLPSSSSNYGYDAQYRWVKGKLEYSQSARVWRLRYIPPDAANDNYGGSVILADASNRLSSFQHGEFVVAYGTLGQPGSDKGSFAAMYNVAQIQRQ